MSRHWHNGILFCCGTLFTALTLLVPSLPLAARESRPFWTEKSAFIEGDDLFVVGVASKAKTVEEGRRQAFEQGKVELMNYAQVTSLEAQGLVIETQMTHEEPNADGTVTVYRLLRVPATKLVAIQGRLETKGRAQEQALEKARSELLTIQHSLSEKAQKLDQQQRQVEQLLQQLATKVQGSTFDKTGTPSKSQPGAGTLAEKLRQTEAQLDAQEQELETIAKRAHARIRQEQEAFQKKCKHLVLGMTKEEVTAVMGHPNGVADISEGNRYLRPGRPNVGERWSYTGFTYSMWLDFAIKGPLVSIYHSNSQQSIGGCP